MRLVACIVVAALSSPVVADDEKVDFAVLHSFPGLDIIETVNHARYAHGGPPANVWYANVNFEVRDTRAHTLQVRKLEIVNANCGKKPAKTDIQALKISGHELYTWDDADPIAKGTASIKTPAGRPRRLSLRVEFDGITTYGACAFVFDLVVDRVRKKIELPLRVMRMEPLREK